MAARYRTFPVAIHVFFLLEGQVLLLRRCNTGYEDGNYSVPAGHINGDETITQAAVREVKEEVGVDIQPSALKVVGVMHRKSNDERVDFFLAVTVWTGEPTNCEPDKCDELAWFPMHALPANTIPYVQRALENYQRGAWFAEFGW
jgi:ADP-ribose pyrophosphatase YjhB (NUDIX family)